MKLEEIKVTVLEQSSVDYTSLISALLSEIADKLQMLISDKQADIIDLGSLPFPEEVVRNLQHTLGIGEVKAEVGDETGLTIVQETAYIGVWWLSYFDEQQELFLEQIEITFFPKLLQAHPDDISQSINKLQEYLSSSVNN